MLPFPINNPEPDHLYGINTDIFGIESLEAIQYNRGNLKIIDQLKLPLSIEYIHIKTVNDGWNSIKQMNTRGAPAIAIVGCLSLAVELYSTHYESIETMSTFVKDKLDYLVTARPTAVNMAEAADRFKAKITDMLTENGLAEGKKLFISKLEDMLKDDIATNKKIGDLGAKEIYDQIGKSKITILTHCNTGALATAGYGTALGVIRSLHKMGALNHTYCTETRPYNQGSRLTAFELVYEKIPSTLICDSMVASAIESKTIDCIVVGADRIARNGDTANKIGTAQLAILAKYHNIPFYVAAPMTTVDPNCHSGKEIVVEERPHMEVTHLDGKRIAANGIGVWNPAFDITPASIITKIITEKGCVNPTELVSLL